MSIKRPLSDITNTIEAKKVCTEKEQTKPCSKCKKSKPSDMFSKEAKSKDGLHSRCKLCASQHKVLYRSTIPGALHYLLDSARRGAIMRGNKGRADAAICTLTFEDLEDIYKQQKGKAYRYPNKTMSLISGEKWHISIERLDPTKGYYKENVVLCCQEFNGHAQWTDEHIIEIRAHHLRSRTDNYQFNKDEFLASVALRSRKKPTPCTDHTHVEKRQDGQCIKCQNVYNLMYNQTPIGYLRHLVGTMKGSSKYRGTKQNRQDQSYEFEFTFQDMINLYIKQKGLCHISGMPMTLTPRTRWQMSPERIDMTKGYTIDNVVLICHEFNTPAQWNREMYLEWINSIC